MERESKKADLERKELEDDTEFTLIEKKKKRRLGMKETTEREGENKWKTKDEKDERKRNNRKKHGQLHLGKTPKHLSHPPLLLLPSFQLLFSFFAHYFTSIHLDWFIQSYQLNSPWTLLSLAKSIECLPSLNKTSIKQTLFPSTQRALISPFMSLTSNEGKWKGTVTRGKKCTCWFSWSA